MADLPTNQQIDEAVPSSGTPHRGRTNAILRALRDIAGQGGQAAEDLATHKQSGDHDARYLKTAENLEDIDDAAIARLNLGLGSAATKDVSEFGTSDQGAKADNSVQRERVVAAGEGLDGGGDLSQDRTISLSEWNAYRLDQIFALVEMLHEGELPQAVLYQLFTHGASKVDPRIQMVGSAPSFGTQGLRVRSGTIGLIKEPLALTRGTVEIRFRAVADGTIFRLPGPLMIDVAGSRVVARTPEGTQAGAEVPGGEMAAAITWSSGSAWVHLDTGKYGPYSISEIVDATLGSGGSADVRDIAIYSSVINDQAIADRLFDYATVAPDSLVTQDGKSLVSNLSDQITT